MPTTRNKRPVAIVDIGSSSIQITVARVHEAGIETIDRAKFNAKLRIALDRSGRLTSGVMDHVVEKLIEFRQLADAHSAPVKATATATLRAATNADEFVERIQNEAGIEVQVITGFREAALVYAGVRHGLPRLDHQTLVCVDVGGGSTELALGHSAEPIALSSIALGTLVVHRRWLGFNDIGAGRVRRARSAMRARLTDAVSFIERTPIEHYVCTGGSAQRIAKIARLIEGKPTADVHGYPLTQKALEAVISAVSDARSPDGRRSIPGMDPERADQLLGGAIIYLELGRILGLTHWTVSMSAIRTGLLLQMDRETNC